MFWGSFSGSNYEKYDTSKWFAFAIKHIGKSFLIGYNTLRLKEYFNYFLLVIRMPSYV